MKLNLEIDIEIKDSECGDKIATIYYPNKPY